jgi:hypothetical protein
MEIQADLEHPMIEGKTGAFHFCSEPCMEKFTADPLSFVTMEKLTEMKICVGDICTDPECCPEKAVEKVLKAAKPDTVDPCAECEECPGCEEAPPKEEDTEPQSN